MRMKGYRFIPVIWSRGLKKEPPIRMGMVGLPLKNCMSMRQIGWRTLHPRWLPSFTPWKRDTRLCWRDRGRTTRSWNIARKHRRGLNRGRGSFPSLLNGYLRVSELSGEFRLRKLKRLKMKYCNRTVSMSLSNKSMSRHSLRLSKLDIRWVQWRKLNSRNTNSIWGCEIQILLP